MSRSNYTDSVQIFKLLNREGLATRKLLIDAIVGTSMGSMERSAFLEKRGLCFFSGCQHNEDWTWIKPSLEKLPNEELVKIYCESPDCITKDKIQFNTFNNNIPQHELDRIEIDRMVAEDLVALAMQQQQPPISEMVDNILNSGGELGLRERKPKND